MIQASWIDAEGNVNIGMVRVVNISEHGLALELPVVPQESAMVRIQSDRHKLAGAAMVRHISKQGSRCVVGLEFANGMRWTPPWEEAGAAGIPPENGVGPKATLPKTVGAPLTIPLSRPRPLDGKPAPTLIGPPKTVEIRPEPRGPVAASRGADRVETEPAADAKLALAAGLAKEAPAAVQAPAAPETPAVDTKPAVEAEPAVPAKLVEEVETKSAAVAENVRHAAPAAEGKLAVGAKSEMEPKPVLLLAEAKPEVDVKAVSSTPPTPKPAAQVRPPDVRPAAPQAPPAHTAEGKAEIAAPSKPPDTPKSEERPNGSASQDDLADFWHWTKS